MLEVAVFVLTGLVAGAIDGLVNTDVGAYGVLACAALTAAPMLLFGLAAAGLGRLERRYRLLTPVVARIDRCMRRDEDDDRARVIRFQARYLGAVLAIVVTGLGAGWVLRRMWFSDVPAFAIRFSAGAFVVGVLLVLLAFWLGVPLLERALRKLDASFRLPPPPLAGLRFAIFVALPLVVVVAPFVTENRDLLGSSLSPGLWFALLAVCAGVTRRAFRRLGERWPAVVTAASFAVPALWVGLLGFTVVAYDAHSDDAVALEASVGATLGGDLVRRVSDVDHDGASSWLGGGDCAAWNGSRHPRAREIRGNGTDEDCDGLDPPATAKRSVVPAQQFYGRLPESKIRHYNVVWLIVEAFRGDHVSAFGYERNTTPYFDRLAQKSMVFVNAYSQASRTFFSLPSMFTGINPSDMTWLREHKVQQPAGEHVTFAERLGAIGYRSHLVLPGGMKRDYTGLQQGYDEVSSYFLDKNLNKWRRTGAAVADAQAIEFIEDASREGRPFLLTIHYIEPHAPYSRHQGGFPDFGSEDIDRYDQELAYVDRHIGFMTEYLRYRGDLWKNTIVIIVGDHGEEFGEHGRKHHGHSCHQESVHVPLLVRVPGQKPARIVTRVALIDILPTLIELIGLPVGDGELEGQSLLNTRQAPGIQFPPRPIFCTTASMSGRSYLNRAVRAGKLLLTKDVRHSRFELFDLAVDPLEEQNLIDDVRYADRVRELQDALSQTEQGNLKQLY